MEHRPQSQWGRYILRVYREKHVLDETRLISIPLIQERIYVANEYPTFVRTMSMVGQKLTFSRQITSSVRQNLSVLMKNMQILR